jgi:hypothetical protein
MNCQLRIRMLIFRFITRYRKNFYENRIITKIKNINTDYLFDNMIKIIFF